MEVKNCNNVNYQRFREQHLETHFIPPTELILSEVIEKHQLGSIETGLKRGKYRGQDIYIYTLHSNGMNDMSDELREKYCLSLFRELESFKELSHRNFSKAYG